MPRQRTLAGACSPHLSTSCAMMVRANNKYLMSNPRPRRHEPLPLDGVTLMHVRTIGSKGAGELQFHTPWSVCETISGNIAVADIHNNHEPSLHMTCSGLENTRQQVSAIGANTPPAAAYDTRSLQNHQGMGAYSWGGRRTYLGCQRAPLRPASCYQATKPQQHSHQQLKHVPSQQAL